MLKETRLLWIDWAHNVRTRTLARRLGVVLEEITIRGPRLWRYIGSIHRTVGAIRAKRPAVVIATNPSLVLGMFLLVLRKWYGFAVVSDAHYCGVRAENDSWLLQRLLDFHNSRADLVIVTNDNHARFVAGLPGQSYVCQDPLPDVQTLPQSRVRLGPRSVLLICSFSDDEPYEAVFEAFSRLTEDGFTLFVSGNCKRAKTDLSRYAWVRLLGFLPAAEYYQYLQAASIVMDLTTYDDCLVCGAYEALAAEKPLITSRTAALAEYFGDAVVLTEHTPEAIRHSVLSAFAHRHELAQRARNWVARNKPYMDQRISGLGALLLRLGGGEAVDTTGLSASPHTSASINR
jgi:glycosyltransferase involved in cell wall biosynthesis